MPRTLTAFDPFSAAFVQNPYPMYDMYRTEDPVYWGPPATPGIEGTWYLTRYSDVAALLRDPRVGRERRRHLRSDAAPPPAEIRPLIEITSRQMLFRDPPDHTRLRVLVSSAFTPAAAESQRRQLERRAHALMERVAGDGTMDVLADYAVPLIMSAIADLIGVPDDEHEQLRAWSNVFAAAIDVRQSFAAAAKASEAMVAMSDYVRAIAATRRRHPKDDLLSRLVHEHADGDRLTDDEIVAMCCLLLIGGNETGVNLIGNGMFALLCHPNELQRLKRNPALMPTAIDELLRFESPVQMTFRYAMDEVDVGGRRIHRGDSVCLMLAAANRDPERFTDPATLDLARGNNRHLTFGGGIHMCLGAALARLEGHIAFAVLLQRLRNIWLAGDVEWRDLIAFRGLRELPIAFDPE